MVAGQQDRKSLFFTVKPPGGSCTRGGLYQGAGGMYYQPHKRPAPHLTLCKVEILQEGAGWSLYLRTVSQTAAMVSTELLLDAQRMKTSCQGSLALVVESSSWWLQIRGVSVLNGCQLGTAHSHSRLPVSLLSWSPFDPYSNQQLFLEFSADFILMSYSATNWCKHLS